MRRPTWNSERCLETSVTKSLITGKAFIGYTVMGLSSGSASIRVLQVSRGRPLTSAEHEPHLPALQFQRTARSGPNVPGYGEGHPAPPSPGQSGRGTWQHPHLRGFPGKLQKLLPPSRLRYFSSATIFFKSTGISGTGDWRSFIALPSCTITLFLINIANAAFAERSVPKVELESSANSPSRRTALL